MEDTLLKPILLDLLNDVQITQQTLVTELSDVERAAVGRLEHWTARDHVAHLTFWKQRLLLRLTAVEHNEAPPRFDDFEQLNAQIFEEQRERSCSFPTWLRGSKQDSDLASLLDEQAQ